MLQNPAITCVLAAFCAQIPAIQARNEPGTYSVGQQTIVLLDRQREGRRLITDIWYPRMETPAISQVAATDSDDGPRILGSPDRYRLPGSRRRQAETGESTGVIRNAPAAAGKFPIVLFSHGLTAVRDQSMFLTQYWASHGYVVVAPDHQGNTGYDFNPLQLYQSGLDRPRDLRFVLNQLCELDRVGSWELAGKMRLDRVAATGHSLGGYSALALGGAWIHVKGMPVKLEPGEHPDYYEISDPRIACVIAMAPVYKPALTAEGLSHLKKPTLVMGGTVDTVTPFQENQRPIYDQLGGRATLVRIEGASHFSFADESMLADAPFFVRAMHKPKIDRAECDQIIRVNTLTFLNENLKP